MVITQQSNDPLCFPTGEFVRETLQRIARMIVSASEREEDSPCRELLEARFMALVERNNALITKICFYFASDNVEFDDLRQDTLLNLWRGLKGFRGDSSESTWIYRICFNTCVSSVKRNSKGTLPLIDVARIDIGDTTEEDREREENITLLHRCISMLNPVDKSIVMMQLDGKSYDEIAEVVGMNRNTVATRLNRARKRISELFKSLTYN